MKPPARGQRLPCSVWNSRGRRKVFRGPASSRGRGREAGALVGVPLSKSRKPGRPDIGG